MRTPLLGIALVACLASPLALAQSNAAPQPRGPVGRAMADFTSLLREASSRQAVQPTSQRNAPVQSASVQAATTPTSVATTRPAGATTAATTVGADPAAVDPPEILEQADAEGVP